MKMKLSIVPFMILILTGAAQADQAECFEGQTPEGQSCSIRRKDVGPSSWVAYDGSCDRSALLDGIAIFDSHDLIKQSRTQEKYKLISGSKNTTATLEINLSSRGSPTSYEYRYWAETSSFLPNGSADHEVNCDGLVRKTD